VARIGWLCFSACLIAVPAAGGELPRVVSRTLSIASPPNATVWANSFYTQAQGQKMMCLMSTEQQSDVYLNWQRRFSEDNGANWSDWESIPPPVQPPAGVHYQFPLPGWIDSGTGRLLQIVLDGVFPTGDSSEGYRFWSLRYRVSDNGGRSYPVDEPVIQKGNHTAQNPVEGVVIGQNSICMGAVSCMPIRTRHQQLLVPVQITRDAGGFHDSAVLVGTWTEGMKIEWDMSQRVVIDSARSSRGLFEPTIAEMPDGRILMVMRGSNGGIAAPGYKWYAVSADGGMNWSDANPWMYDDGSNFYSPSSCSQLLRHSNGNCYWIGNISPDNSSGNDPRYPLVIGQVDPTSLLLMKDTVTPIDIRESGDGSSLQLSNFSAYEDRLSHEIVLSMTRYPGTAELPSGSYTYRIAVPMPEPSGMSILTSALVALLAYGWQKGLGRICRSDRQ
jgi:hypothetical protein